MHETHFQSLVQEVPLEKKTATHSNILAWRTPRTEEPGELPSTGSHRVEHDWSDLAAAAAAVHIHIWFSFPSYEPKKTIFFSTILQLELND